jgi:very-short-patch-repair endonuclease
MEDNILHHSSISNKVDLRKKLRREMPKGERILWGKLRNNHVGGFKFKRQVDFDNYVVDFCCYKLRLVVEVDGSTHEEKMEYDKIREEHLKSLGLTVIKYTSDQVFNNLQDVLNDIYSTCQKLSGEDKK